MKRSHERLASRRERELEKARASPCCVSWGLRPRRCSTPRLRCGPGVQRLPQQPPYVHGLRGEK